MPEIATRRIGHMSIIGIRRSPAGRWARQPQEPETVAESTPDVVELFDARGYKRSASSMPGAGKGRVPGNKGRTYPPSPPNVEELVSVMEAFPETPHGRRGRAIIVVCWRTGLRISEALALEFADLDEPNVIVRRGKGGKFRVVGMDTWGWRQLDPWLTEREQYPAGPVFCVLQGPTCGTRALSTGQFRDELHRGAKRAGLFKRLTPHQLRHMMACDWLREEKSIYHLQRQLGHSHLGVTTRYLSSVSSEEVVQASVDRPPPTMLVPDLMSAFRGRRK